MHRVTLKYLHFLWSNFFDFLAVDEGLNNLFERSVALVHKIGQLHFIGLVVVSEVVSESTGCSRLVIYEVDELPLHK